MTASAIVLAVGSAALSFSPAQAQAKRPNIVMLMMDDVGWSDFGAYAGGGKALGHPTPNIDRVAKEGAMFTSWYGQSSCTAGRSSFITGRIPIRTALSVVVAPGDENGLRKETPTIAEFFKKNGYQTYFSGKWHLGDKPEFYPIEHGFDEMKEFAAYYPGVYSYDDTSPNFHPWFPKYNEPYWKEYQDIVNLDEWEGVAGKPATKVARITYDYLANFDVRQADSAVAYIKQHAKDDKPFFMDVNFMKMHNPTNPRPAFRGKSKLGNYSDSMLELDANVGRVMDAIRAEAPDTIVIITSRQRRMAGCLAGCRRDAVPWREGKRIRRRLPRAGHHVGAGQDSGRGRPGPDDVAHGCVADDRSDGRPHAAATWGMGRQRRQAHLFRRDRQQCLRDRQVAVFRAEFVHLYRRRDVRRRARRHRRGPG